MLAQAMTALGDELLSLGDGDGGVDCYRKVVGFLDGSEVDVLTYPAKRKLHALGALVWHDHLN